MQKLLDFHDVLARFYKPVAMAGAIAAAFIPISPTSYTYSIALLQVYEFRYLILIVLFFILYKSKILRSILYYVRFVNYAAYMLVRQNYAYGLLAIIQIILCSAILGFLLSSAARVAYRYYGQFAYFGTDIVRQKLIRRANQYNEEGDLRRANSLYQAIIQSFPDDVRNRNLIRLHDQNLDFMNISSLFLERGREMVGDHDNEIGYDLISASLYYWPYNEYSIDFVREKYDFFLRNSESEVSAARQYCYLDIESRPDLDRAVQVALMTKMQNVYPSKLSAYSVICDEHG